MITQAPTESAGDLLSAMRGGLIVSCQAYPGEPLRDSRAMLLMAQSAVVGGAVAIRAQGLDDIALIAGLVDVPQIGLVKVGAEGVFITPTVADALAVASAGAQIVALDGTRGPRPDGISLRRTIELLHEQTDVLVMADIDDVDSALAAQDAGADLIGTTLSGYSGARPLTVGPDLELIADVAGLLDIPVLAEGRVQTPAQARAALDAGAYAVVVGTAITHPTTITRTFVDAMGS